MDGAPDRRECGVGAEHVSELGDGLGGVGSHATFIGAAESVVVQTAAANMCKRSKLGASNMPNKASGIGRCALKAADARVGLECRGKGLCTLGAEVEVVVPDAASTRTFMASAVLGAINMPNKASGDGIGHT